MKTAQWWLLWTVTLLLPAAEAQQDAPAAPARPKPLGTFLLHDLTFAASLGPFAAEIASPREEGRSLSPEAVRRYGFDKRTGVGYSLKQGSPNEDYQRARPFGEMTLERVEQPYNNYKPGVLAVQAFRKSWSRRDDLLNYRTVPGWRWEVPKELQYTFAEFSEMVYGDRYAALCLVPPGWEADPTLLLFDAASGLRWQSEVPLHDALRQYARREKPVDLAGAALSGSGLGLVFTHRTRDGSRTLLTIGWDKPVLTLLFVYDKQGKLLKTVVLPDRVVTRITRTPTAELFVLDSSRRGPESFLLDADGTPLGKFVDDEGKTIQVERLSDTHAYAVRDRKQSDGAEEYRKFMYELPKK